MTSGKQSPVELSREKQSLVNLRPHRAPSSELRARPAALDDRSRILQGRTCIVVGAPGLSEAAKTHDGLEGSEIRLR